ncbi:MAG TPA: response regulator [Chitinophagaceae bacterium]|nr:response regulator [Chitinophagaceae bacterium]
MKPVSELLNILIVEDNPADCIIIREMLSSSRSQISEVYEAEVLSQALQHLATHRINVVLLDLSLPDSFGTDSLFQLREVAPNVPIVILTGLNDSEIALEALNKGAQDYLVKGEFNTGFLVKSIKYSIERKKAEEKVRISEEKYRQIFYKNPFPMWISELDTSRILEVNDAAIQKYGYERAEFLKLCVTDIQQDRECAGGKLPNGEHPAIWGHKKKNGETILVEFTSYPINYLGRTAMQAQIHDVTEKIKLQHELAAKKKQIIEAVLTAQENERRAIGIELHDNINQILSSIQLTLGYALEHPAQMNELLARSVKSTALAIEEIRKLSKALILPGNIKNLGLASSIEVLIKDILPVTGIKIDLDTLGLQENALSEEQKITLYRIVQEQLNNILKHSGSSAVNIRLLTAGKQVRLLIQDNGKGFDPRANRKGIGITNIMSRAELFNGKVDINSSPGHGCQLEVVLRSRTPSSNGTVYEHL